ncbi:MAG: cobalamin biosynthesis protein CbiG [Pseudomonadota bacterium]
MAAPLFDSVIVIDWSAASVRSRGKDSIWMAEARVNRPAPGIRVNLATRAEAVAVLAERMRRARGAGERLLAAFDFPFGYPVGSAALMTDGGGPPWQATWSMLGTTIEEAPKNGNNRFQIAAALNARIAAATGVAPGPFWGRPAALDLADLPVKKPTGYGDRWPSEFRHVDAAVQAEARRRPSSCWQLFYNPTVGGQALTGIAALERLRRDPDLSDHLLVWPFETGLAPPETAAGTTVLAEVYPSLIHRTVAASTRPGEVRDAAQVRVLARALARLDATGALAPIFSGPDTLTPAERRDIEVEEAWVLGAGHAAALAAAVG